MSAALFRHLEVFRTVMDAGTATLAAERLGISQPSVSQHLAQIESKLGLVLFAREHGRLVPTSDGLALYDELAFAFNGLDRIMNYAQDVQARNRGILRIALPHSLCHTIMPKALARFAEAYPRIRYEISLGYYPQIIAKVAARSVDLGVAKAPVSDPAIASQPVASCGNVCVIGRGHRLKAARRVTIADIADEPLIMIGRQSPWRSEIDVLFRHAKRVPRIRLETGSVGSACSFAAVGLGVAIVPDLLARQFVSREIVAVPLEAPVQHDFVVVYPAALHSRDVASDFARILADVMTCQTADVEEQQVLT